MKIGFIDYVFKPQFAVGTDGLSEVVWNLAAPLAEMGHDVHIAAPYATDIYPSNAVKVHRFSVSDMAYRTIFGHMWIIHRAIQTLRPYGPFDILHAPESVSTAMLGRLERHTPVVLTEPGNIYDRIENGNPYAPIMTQVLKLAARDTARTTARLMATSDEMGYWWARTGFKPRKIVRIPLPVNLEEFKPVPDAKHVLGWSAEQKHLLFLSRLSGETGPQYLLEALPAIRRAYPNIFLHMVGSGSTDNAMKKKAEQLGVSDIVKWYGWLKLSELSPYYSAADVMIFPGTSGGTPRVMLQAMACGAPFVGSAIGGITDHIEQGKTGWLVPPRDTAALADTFITVLAHPDEARCVGKNAQEYVQRLKASTIAARVVREIYEPILAEASAKKSQQKQTAHG